MRWFWKAWVDWIVVPRFRKRTRFMSRRGALMQRLMFEADWDGAGKGSALYLQKIGRIPNSPHVKTSTEGLASGFAPPVEGYLPPVPLKPKEHG